MDWELSFGLKGKVIIVTGLNASGIGKVVRSFYHHWEQALPYGISIGQKEKKQSRKLETTQFLLNAISHQRRVADQQPQKLCSNTALFLDLSIAPALFGKDVTELEEKGLGYCS